MSALLIVYSTDHSAEERSLPILFFSQYLSQVNAGNPNHILSLLSKARELYESLRWEMKLHTIVSMKHHMKTLNHPVWRSREICTPPRGLLEQLCTEILFTISQATFLLLKVTPHLKSKLEVQGRLHRYQWQLLRISRMHNLHWYLAK